MSTRNLPSFDELADAVVVDGVAAHADTLRQLASVAYEAGVSPALVAIVADRAQPEVARLRALGRVLAALDAPVEPHAPPTTAVA